VNAALRLLLAPIASRVRLIVSRGLLRLLDDEAKVQLAQVSALRGELLGGVPRMGHFGLTSRPPAGTEVVLVCPGGSRDQAVVIADEHRASRPAGELEVGDVMVYAVGSARVHVRADGSVAITAPTGVTVSADLEAGGNVVAGGDVEDAVGTLAALRTAYNAHTHPDPQGGSTGPPVPTV